MNHIIIMLLAFVLVACGNSEPVGEEKESHVRSVKITTAMSELRDVDVVEEALGRVLDTAATIISAEIPARVREVRFDIGDRVTKGAVLARLDKSDMKVAVATAEANLAREKSQVEAQARLVVRYQKLANDRFVSTTMLDQAESQLVAMQKASKAAQAQLNQAKNNLARTNVVAPVGGIVQKRFVAAGDYIGVGKPIFQLVTDDHFVISIIIPETKIHAIKVGIPVRMHLPGSDQVIHAPITDLSPMIGSTSNAFEARVKIKNPENWRPGGSVVTELIIDTHKQAVVVPEACVVLRPAGIVVYVIDGTHAKARPVKTGVRKDGYVEILSGLKPGVLLASTGASFLSDGATVKVMGAMQ